MRVTALRIHRPRQRVWRVSMKEGQIQKQFCICIWTANALANIANRQPLAPIWEWVLWDFSQEFLHVSPHQAIIVSAAWDLSGPVGRAVPRLPGTNRQRQGRTGGKPAPLGGAQKGEETRSKQQEREILSRLLLREVPREENVWVCGKPHPPTHK